MGDGRAALRSGAQPDDHPTGIPPKQTRPQRRPADPHPGPGNATGRASAGRRETMPGRPQQPDHRPRRPKHRDPGQRPPGHRLTAHRTRPRELREGGSHNPSRRHPRLRRRASSGSEKTADRNIETMDNGRPGIGSRLTAHRSRPQELREGGSHNPSRRHPRLRRRASSGSDGDRPRSAGGPPQGAVVRAALLRGRWYWRPPEPSGWRRGRRQEWPRGWGYPSCS